MIILHTPEGYHFEDYYVDKGCRASPSCLKCPLPKCKHDGGSGHSILSAYAKNQRVSTAQNMFRNGMKLGEIANELQCSVKTITRYLSVV